MFPTLLCQFLCRSVRFTCPLEGWTHCISESCHSNASRLWNPSGVRSNVKSQLLDSQLMEVAWSTRQSWICDDHEYFSYPFWDYRPSWFIVCSLVISAVHEVLTAVGTNSYHVYMSYSSVLAVVWLCLPVLGVCAEDRANYVCQGLQYTIMSECKLLGRC